MAGLLVLAAVPAGQAFAQETVSGTLVNIWEDPLPERGEPRLRHFLSTARGELVPLRISRSDLRILGGAMAANYVHSNPEAAHGLVLWAAYPTASGDLSGYQLAASSIYGTRDGLATLDEINASRPLLPPDTQWVDIEGVNHAQFGWYGPQAGDNEPAISREEQQAQIVVATLQLLQQVGE